MSKQLKKTLFDFCSVFVNDRISRIERIIKNLEDSLKSETKSTAGDKHETGRAMVQLEREKMGKQLAEAEKMKHLLAKVPLENTNANIGLGSWVQTSENNYFLAISAGEANTNGISTYCISTATPIGRLLLGKTVGDTIEFKGTKMLVNKIA